MKVLAGQSMFDMAIQHSGTVEAAFELALENDISLTDTLTVGDELLEREIVNRRIFDYYKRNGFEPATGETDTEQDNGGINFMGIEIDFIVS